MIVWVVLGAGIVTWACASIVHKATVAKTSSLFIMVVFANVQQVERKGCILRIIAYSVYFIYKNYLPKTSSINTRLLLMALPLIPAIKKTLKNLHFQQIFNNP